MAVLRRKLASGEPLDLLAEVSSLVNALDPRSASPMSPPEGHDELPTLAELVASFIEVDRPETTALLAGLAHLADDELLRARARRAVAGRQHPLPDWLQQLGATTVTSTVRMEHVLRDGDNIVVGLRLGSGHPICLVAYVDHNLGTLVKDAFAVPEPFDELLAAMAAAADDPDVTFVDLDPADARAQLVQAIDRAAMTFPPFETDSWPACRPLLEWALRLLPDGGEGFVRPAWPEADRAALAERFFASVPGRPFDDAVHRALIDPLLAFACDYGPGDPLRWSPTSVEIALTDFFPRKVLAPASVLADLPALLSAFVRFCHGERQVRRALTDDTLATIDELAPEFRQAIASPARRAIPGSLLRAALRDGDEAAGRAVAEIVAAGTTIDWDDDTWDEDDDDWDDELDALAELLDTSQAGMGRRMLALLADAVGGPAALDQLGTEPLPDEPFDWSVVPDDIRPVVGEVLDLLDGCCDDRLDVEYRTACRRLLAKVVAGDPRVFRRRGSPTTAAAAICWAVGKANDLFFAGHGGISTTATALLSWFGLSGGSVSQRASTLLRAAGYSTWYGGDVRLGDPGLLVSSYRATVISRRDRARQWLAD
jgi:hypothetical protein